MTSVVAWIEVNGGVGTNRLNGKDPKRTINEKVLYLDYGDGYVGISICQNFSNCTLKIGTFYYM